MSTANAQSFVQKVASDSEFANSLRSCTNEADAKKLIAGSGIGDFSIEELQSELDAGIDVIKMIVEKGEELGGSGELSDEQLENVAGGSKDCSGEARCEKNQIICTKIDYT